MYLSILDLEEILIPWWNKQQTINRALCDLITLSTISVTLQGEKIGLLSLSLQLNYQVHDVVMTEQPQIRTGGFLSTLAGHKI